ncbi:hypothetical protein T439DRAFT_381991 [Meredithblackwellia eburnea MCA 4105]
MDPVSIVISIVKLTVTVQGKLSSVKETDKRLAAIRERLGGLADHLEDRKDVFASGSGVRIYGLVTTLLHKASALADEVSNKNRFSRFLKSSEFGFKCTMLNEEITMVMERVNEEWHASHDARMANIHLDVLHGNRLARENKEILEGFMDKLQDVLSQYLLLSPQEQENPAVVEELVRSNGLTEDMVSDTATIRSVRSSMSGVMTSEALDTFTTILTKARHGTGSVEAEQIDPGTIRSNPAEQLLGSQNASDAIPTSADGHRLIEQPLGEGAEQLPPQQIPEDDARNLEAFTITAPRSYLECIWSGAEEICFSFSIEPDFVTVSFIHLVPNACPINRIVSIWPQGSKERDMRLPTVLAYNQEGTLLACGNEALSDNYSSGILMGRVVIVKSLEYFLLTEHPNLPAWNSSLNVLPPNKTIWDCYRDIIEYSYKHTRAFYLQNTPDGQETLERLEGMQAVKFIFACPDEWGLDYQSRIRMAVVEAHAVESSTASQRVKMIPRSLAAYCKILEERFNNHLEKDIIGSQDCPQRLTRVYLINLGQYYSYACCVESSSIQVPSDCGKLSITLDWSTNARRLECGSEYIIRGLRSLLAAKLSKSQRYNTPKVIEMLVEHFRNHALKSFSATDENYLLRFGTKDDTDLACGISQGRMKLTGVEIESLLKPQFETIRSAIESMIACERPRRFYTQCIYTFGGFGASQYWEEQLIAHFRENRAILHTIEHLHSFVTFARGGAICHAWQGPLTRTTPASYP